MGMMHALTRRKALSAVVGEQSELGKVLSVYDLIALGVGCTLGVGVYVLPGVVSRDVAGPGVVLSFFYAAVASILAGLCYAEFGARVPKAGSAYVYSYVTVGEFIAFMIGWNLIIEYIIGGASVARGVSVYLDSLFDNRMSTFFRSIYSIDSPYLSEYVDFFALTISILVCVALAVGLKESLTLNNMLTFVNCSVVVFVIVIGGIYADVTNWNLQVPKIPVGYGDGGFLPYGLLGTLRGASTCFYGFVGFDVIATSGEEARNPQVAIPLSIIVSLLIIFIAYSGVSSVLTLMWPYFLQDIDAPLPFVFEQLDLSWAKWVVTVGALFGLSTSLFGGMFPLPRVVYAMSQDGLLFEFLGRVHPTYKTPFIGTVLSGVLTGVMAGVFRLKNLVDLMSMATLVCYTMVAMSVLILRYRKEKEDKMERVLSESTPLLNSSRHQRAEMWMNPPEVPVESMVYSLTLLCGLLAWCLVGLQNRLAVGEEPHWLPFICFNSLLFISFIIVHLHFRLSNTPPGTFQMPGVPVLPSLSIFFNLYLMCLMDLNTWVQFILWLIAGMLIYFGYGIWHSKENDCTKTDCEQLQENGKLQL